MMATYHVCEKNSHNGKSRMLDNSRAVSIFMLGRLYNNYFVIKTDEKGSRLVPPFTDGDINQIQVELDRA